MIHHVYKGGYIARLVFLMILTSLLLTWSHTFAQRIEATVTINYDRLSREKKERLTDFGEKIEHYINSYDWCEDPWNTVVYVYIELIPRDIASGAEERYSGEILVNNNYDIQYFDKRWRFAYQSGEMLIHEESYLNPFTNMIDFYIYLILGGEFDKWGTLGGTVYFEKAKYIAEQSKFGLARYIDGWDRRLDLVTHLLSDMHKPYREMVDYYFYGLSFIKQDNAKARQHCATAIKMLDKILADDPENEHAKNFISAHHIELIEIYRRAKDKEPIRMLMILDPENERAYRDVLES